jgi:hypothetical protein
MIAYALSAVEEIEGAKPSNSGLSQFFLLCQNNKNVNLKWGTVGDALSQEKVD